LGLIARAAKAENQSNLDVAEFVRIQRNAGLNSDEFSYIETLLLSNLAVADHHVLVARQFF
jgi:hypothetical protein